MMQKIMTMGLLSFLLITGATYQKSNSRKIASTDTQCQQQNMIAALKQESEELQKKLDSIDQLLVMSKAKQYGVQFQTIAYMTYSDWQKANPSYSQSYRQRYHDQVMEQQQRFITRSQNNWSPLYNYNGDLSNPLYGHGPNTFSNITAMYNNPTSTIPELSGSYYQSPLQEQIDPVMAP